mmetsp:Transcript_5224/g.14435  ORF Transcript_5224/g.14435 Transcript_5224/m.14435 type:complete len:228 (-) Transcript_5224:117-800(-)
MHSPASILLMLSSVIMPARASSSFMFSAIWMHLSTSLTGSQDSTMGSPLAAADLPTTIHLHSILQCGGSPTVWAGEECKRPQTCTLTTMGSLPSASATGFSASSSLPRAAFSHVAVGGKRRPPKSLISMFERSARLYTLPTVSLTSVLVSRTLQMARLGTSLIGASLLDPLSSELMRLIIPNLLAVLDMPRIFQAICTASSASSTCGVSKAQLSVGMKHSSENCCAE